VGFFHHRRVDNGIYLGGEYQYSLKLIKERVSLDLPVGLGYLHSIYPGEVYKQTDDGGFKKINQFGRPHGYVHLGIGLTYLHQGWFQPFIRQELWLDTRFLPHSFIKLGIQIKNEKQED